MSDGCEDRRWDVSVFWCVVLNCECLSGACVGFGRRPMVLLMVLPGVMRYGRRRGFVDCLLKEVTLVIGQYEIADGG